MSLIHKGATLFINKDHLGNSEMPSLCWMQDISSPSLQGTGWGCAVLRGAFPEDEAAAGWLKGGTWGLRSLKEGHGQNKRVSEGGSIHGSGQEFGFDPGGNEGV